MELHYELDVLEDVVFETFDPTKLIDVKLSNIKTSELLQSFINEKEASARKIRKAASQLNKGNRKALYLQLQQAGITRMMDAIHHYLSFADNAIAVKEFYIKTYSVLEQWLHKFKKNYSKHFDVSMKLPDGYKRKYEQGMKEMITFLKEKLEGKVSKSFLELICEPFEHFISTRSEYNYERLEYLTELRLCLLNAISTTTPNIESTIADKLLYLNFNSVLFFNYYILRISAEAAKRKTITERVEYFSWQIKTLNQTRIKINTIYLKHLEPIKDQLIFWITEDLYYLNKKHQLSLTLPKQHETQKDSLKKVHVQLTVADLAFGAKLLLDTEVIVNMNYTELMKHVAKGFRTNRQANISQQAIYNVGFEASNTSKEKMKQVLMKMVMKIGEY